MPKTPLTEYEREEVTRLRAKGTGWDTIARIVGVTRYQIRCQMDPDFYELRRNKDRERWRENNQNGQQRTPIPLAVLADRDRRLSLSHASITAALFGDPLPTCSALDRRNGME